MRAFFAGIAVFLSASVALRAENYEALLKNAYGYGAFTYGMYAFSKGEKKEALDAFALANEKDPKLGRAFFHKADILFEEGKLSEAIATYRAAIELEPDFVFAYYNLACAYSKNGDAENALKAIEDALRLGYKRYDKIESDPDLAPLKNLPKFAELIKSYRQKNIQASASVKFLLQTPEEKAGLIMEILRTKDPEWKIIADEALLNDIPDVRSGGTALYATLGSVDQALPVLVRGIYDNNGYVNKLAANSMVSIGSPSMPYVDAILASQDKGAKFYAQQIKKLIEAKAAAKPKS